MIAAGAFFIAWAAVVHWGRIEPFLVPSPWAVLKALAEDRQILLVACLLTGQAAVAGLALSILVGTIIGLVFTQVPVLRRALFPYAIFLQTVPIVAIAPLIVLWMGYGIVSVIVVAFILSLFPIITNVTAGMTSVPASYDELFRLNRATFWQRFTKLQFPYAIPHLMTGIKVSGGLAVIGSIVGEFFVGYAGQDPGLGFLIRQSSEMVRTDRLFAVVLLATLLGVCIFATVCLLSDVVLRRWNQR